MSTENYDLAIKTFMIEAEALTDAQIDLLKTVDDQLANRAIRKRGECQTKAAAARHASAMGQPAAKASVVEQMVDGVVDQITLALVQPRQRIKSLEDQNTRIKMLEDQNTALQQQVRDVLDRMLELEATHHVNANH